MGFVWQSILCLKSTFNWFSNYSQLSPRLDQNDFNTITNNDKYLALRQETVLGDAEGPLVILTKAGIAYLKNKWGKSVNKNGKRCPSASVSALKPKIPAVRRGDAQRYDNMLFNLILPFYTVPVRLVFDLIEIV